MNRPRVLILDDGELDRLDATLRRLGLAPLRVSGDEIEDGLPMPSDLLITTGSRALSGPQLAATGNRVPTRICVDTENSHPLRERLSELGVDYLVHSNTSDASLDLFFTQLLHSSSERRTEPRQPLRCEVRWSWRNRTQQKATLLDVSTGGIRLDTADEIPVGAQIEIDLPSELAGDAVALPARVDRCDPVSASGSQRWEIALLWESLERSERRLIDALSAGRHAAMRFRPLQPSRYVDGAGIPDWDEMARVADRRGAPRHRYDGHVDVFGATPGTGPIGVLGRDLSERGMRIEPVRELEVGSELTVAIHGGNQSDPLLLDARVERRHSDDSLGLSFTLLDSATRAAIAELLDTLPRVASLDAGERILPSEITLR